ncbi:MAG: efflux transporter outer membrane subunit [Gammaproteobacteria bacterium]|nr:efflux transporter outer membrane subunit [Gammaproteobacteria bacterium]
MKIDSRQYIKTIFSGSGRLNTIVLNCLMALLINGCTALGPDYLTPEVNIESGWNDAKDAKVSSLSTADPKWWEAAFQDAEINHLVETALQQNLSLQSAGLRVLQSQQKLAIAIGNQYPQQQQVTGLAAREKSGGVIFNDYNLGLNLSWEIDFWGRFKRQIESASADLDASVADYDNVLISLISQLARNYILIRTFQERIKVARNNIKLQRDSLRIAQAKYKAGDVSELDVDQADSLLNKTIATVSTLEISLYQFKNSLAVLLGKSPQEYNYLLAEKRKIPTTQAEIAIGMPQDIIRKRPDIRSAERQLAAQSAEIGFAVTELYPHLGIGGSIGTSAEHSSDLFSSDAEIWNLYGMFQWNIFNYGRLKSNVRLQDALFQQMLVDYYNTILQAQVDVENAIVAYLKSHEQLKSYELATNASQRAVNVSNTQYKNGLINFNTVISNLQELSQQQDLLSSARGNVATNLVQVYKALGGGWEIRDSRDPVDLLPDAVKDEMRERTSDWEEVFQ